MSQLHSPMHPSRWDTPTEAGRQDNDEEHKLPRSEDEAVTLAKDPSTAHSLISYVRSQRESHQSHVERKESQTDD